MKKQDDAIDETQQKLNQQKETISNLTSGKNLYSDLFNY
jgi:hypothetical protein